MYSASCALVRSASLGWPSRMYWVSQPVCPLKGVPIIGAAPAIPGTASMVVTARASARSHAESPG